MQTTKVENRTPYRIPVAPGDGPELSGTMEGAQQFLEALRHRGVLAGHFRGLLHVLIGGRITSSDGTVLSTGLTWREVATVLKKVRWDRTAVRELGLNPADLPPRDRERYWYAVINRAELDSDVARQSAAALARAVQTMGFTIT